MGENRCLWMPIKRDDAMGISPPTTCGLAISYWNNANRVSVMENTDLQRIMKRLGKTIDYDVFYVKISVRIQRIGDVGVNLLFVVYFTQFCVVSIINGISYRFCCANLISYQDCGQAQWTDLYLVTLVVDVRISGPKLIRKDFYLRSNFRGVFLVTCENNKMKLQVICYCVENVFNIACWSESILE